MRVRVSVCLSVDFVFLFFKQYNVIIIAIIVIANNESNKDNNSSNNNSNTNNVQNDIIYFNTLYSRSGSIIRPMKRRETMHKNGHLSACTET